MSARSTISIPPVLADKGRGVAGSAATQIVRSRSPCQGDKTCLPARVWASASSPSATMSSAPSRGRDQEFHAGPVGSIGDDSCRTRWSRIDHQRAAGARPGRALRAGGRRPSVPNRPLLAKIISRSVVSPGHHEARTVAAVPCSASIRRWAILWLRTGAVCQSSAAGTAPSPPRVRSACVTVGCPTGASASPIVVRRLAEIGVAAELGLAVAAHFLGEQGRALAAVAGEELFRCRRTRRPGLRAP